MLRVTDGRTLISLHDQPTVKIVSYACESPSPPAKLYTDLETSQSLRQLITSVDRWLHMQIKFHEAAAAWLVRDVTRVLRQFRGMTRL